MISDDIKRLNYYEKQFLGARDFRDEQGYHIEMRRRHLIAHHSWGVVAGLEITEDANSKIWSLQPGIAVDGYGREILVFDPEPLNVQSIADQLAGSARPTFLKIWIAYQLEKSNKPSAGFEACGIPDQFMRTRETFRIIYQNDPPFDLGRAADPIKKDPNTETNWPVPFQDLPDDPGSARWPVYLGTLTWDQDPNNPNQNIITSVPVVDPNDNQRRRYIGAIAAEIEAPDNKLLIRGRGNPSPLPPNSTDAGYYGVPVEIEGTLQIDRQVTADTDLIVLGKVGIGIASSASPDTKLQVDGGTDAALANGSGYVVVGNVAKNIVMDNHGLMARKAGATSELDLQIEGGDVIVHKNKPGTEIVLKDSGEVGIGTTTPAGKLTLNSAVPTQGTLTFFSSGADMEYDGGTDRTFVVRNSAANGKTAFMGGDFGIDIVPAVKLDVAPGGVFIRHLTADGMGGRALEVGSQSNATNLVPNGRIGFPGYTIQHGQLRWVPGASGTGRFEFVDSSNSAPSGDYGLAPALVNTRAKDGIFTGNVGIGTASPTHRLEVGGDGVFTGNVGIGTNSPTHKLEVAGDVAAANLFTGLAFRVFAGRTLPGLGWQVYTGNGIFIDVNTSAAGFTATPLYITSIHGDQQHWATTGGSSVYNPTPTGFRIYVRWWDGTVLTPAQANSNNWHIQWIGIQL
jgi:hypothetical protein